MPIKITNKGKNNVVSVDPDILEQGSGSILIEGDDNIITVAKTVYRFSGMVSVGSGCIMTVDENVNGRNIFVHMVRNAKLIIGRGTSFNGLVRMLLHEPGSMSLGSGCLLADQVELSVSDMHSVVDLTSGERLNPAKDIVIEDRVWIGQRSLVMKGVTIGTGAVIGAQSVVAKSIPSNCVAAGIPARIIRENATWNFQLI